MRERERESVRERERERERCCFGSKAMSRAKPNLNLPPVSPLGAGSALCPIHHSSLRHIGIKFPLILKAKRATEDTTLPNRGSHSVSCSDFSSAWFVAHGWIQGPSVRT